MTEKVTVTRGALIRRTVDFDNPILRHFVKKHLLEELDTLVLGVLLDLTDQTKTPVRTSYTVIAETAGLPAIEAYRCIETLHRYRIIEYKPAGSFVHISFREIEDTIEEIALAYINARKIKRLEDEVSSIRKKNFVPSSELFDIIYPLVGKLIARKIAEAFRALADYIDERLESSLSLSMWKYRWIARRTKIPLAEVILRESLPFFIDEIFLIEKKSSLVIGHASRAGAGTIDSDLVGGMLAAIQDFIRTSFRKKHSELNEIHFGHSRILVTESIYFHTAIVLQGAPSMEFTGMTDEIIHDIHIAFRNGLRNFNGNMAPLQGIEAPLSALIARTNGAGPAAEDGARSYRKLKIAGAVLAALLAALAARSAYQAVTDHRLKGAIVSRLAREMPPYSHDTALSVNGGRVTVTGTVSSKEAAETLGATVSAIGGVKEVENRTVIADYRTVDRMRAEIARFEERMELIQLMAVRQDLEKIIVQFPAGVSAMDNARRLQVARAYEILKSHPLIRIDLVAFADPEGGVKVNRDLAGARMEAVRDRLVALGMEGDRIRVTEFDPGILGSDPRYAEYKDRRGIMMFAKFRD